MIIVILFLRCNRYSTIILSGFHLQAKAESKKKTPAGSRY